MARRLLAEQPPLAAVAALSWYRWLVVGTVCVGAFLGQLDASIAGLVLPTLEDVFRTPVADVEWVAIAYLLTLAVLIVPIGRLADLTGRKLLYTAGFLVFVLRFGPVRLRAYSELADRLPRPSGGRRRPAPGQQRGHHHGRGPAPSARPGDRLSGHRAGGRPVDRAIGRRTADQRARLAVGVLHRRALRTARDGARLAGAAGDPARIDRRRASRLRLARHAGAGAVGGLSVPRVDVRQRLGLDERVPLGDPRRGGAGRGRVRGGRAPLTFASDRPRPAAGADVRHRADGRAGVVRGAVRCAVPAAVLSRAGARLRAGRGRPAAQPVADRHRRAVADRRHGDRPRRTAAPHHGRHADRHCRARAAWPDLVQAAPA